MSREFTDDASLRDEINLWRRIPPWHVIFDENLQRWRPSSAAFDNDADGEPMSVVIAEEALAQGRSPAALVVGHEGYGLASVTVGLVRACGQGVTRDPMPDEPAHALVFGPKPKSVQRRLAKGAVWVIPPPLPA
jgi:hypothetical protein